MVQSEGLSSSSSQAKRGLGAGMTIMLGVPVLERSRASQLTTQKIPAASDGRSKNHEKPGFAWQSPKKVQAIWGNLQKVTMRVTNLKRLVTSQGTPSKVRRVRGAVWRCIIDED